MDKYEFNIKVEQIKKMASERDYVTAMKIADSIDWSRVRNANLLSMVAGVYEKNNEYQEAKDILLMAFERAPVGKRLLYKLAEVAVKSGDIEEAEDFYREFVDLAPEDSRAFLLEYMILKAKGAPPAQLIHSLEQYTSQELDERWLYELAMLYARAGMGEECVRACDKITLLFGLGKYSERAMQLKQQFTELSDYQRDLVGNPEKYENKLKQVEQQSAQKEAMYERGYEALREAVGERADAGMDPEEIAESRYADEDAEFEAYLKAHAMEMEMEVSDEEEEEPEEADEASREIMPEAEVEYEADQEPEDYSDQLSEEVSRLQEEEEPEEDADAELEKTRVLDDDVKEKLRKVVIRTGHPKETPVAINPDPEAAKAAAVRQAAVLAGAAVSAAGHAERAAAHATPEVKKAEPPRPQARVEFTHTEPAKKEEQEAAEAQQPETPAAKAPERPPVPIKKEAKPNPAEQKENAEIVAAHGPFHMIIEAETPEEGLEIAIDELKYIHNEYGITNAAAKSTAEKLNQKGLSKAAIEKLRGKDFIVEHAGSLNEEICDAICDLMENDRSGMIVVLVDTPEGLDRLEEICPEAFDLCDLVSDEYDEEEDYPEEAEAVEEEEEDLQYDEEPYEDEYEESYEDSSYEADIEEAPAPKKSASGKENKKAEERIQERQPAEREAKGGKASVPDNKEMEIDEFAQYCCQYAASIDCSITGKSMLALYERIELMEEDNIPLTKKTAEDLIEEAADLAEKPPIGKRIKGMFNSKYDKNGLLILREEDFIH